jgi:hypothetical protein
VSLPVKGRRVVQPVRSTTRNAGYAIRLTVPVPYAATSLTVGSKHSTR